MNGLTVNAKWNRGIQQLSIERHYRDILALLQSVSMLKYNLQRHINDATDPEYLRYLRALK